MFHSIRLVLGLLVAFAGIYFVTEDPLAGSSALFVGAVLILGSLNRMYGPEP